MQNENVAVKNKCHSRMFLSGIYNACRCQIKEISLLNKYVEDSRQKPSGMTALWMSGQGLTYKEAVLNKGLFRAPLRSGFTLPCHAELVSASSCYNNNKTLKQVQGDDIRGFTLIELLIVVLIIGILAAVALSQYQQAVAKSRALEGLTLLRTVMRAEELYYLANGDYTKNVAQLDIQISDDKIANTWGAADETIPNKYMISCNGVTKTFACIASVTNEDLPNFFQSGRFATEATIGKVEDIAGLFDCAVSNKSATALKICKSMGKELTANRDYILD